MPTKPEKHHLTQSDNSRWHFIAFCVTVICFFFAGEVLAKDYSFSWSANPEPVEGYRLYYKKGADKSLPFNGTDALQGASPIAVGKQTTFTIKGLEDNTTYHFALTAYNGTEESAYSDIISVFETTTTPPPAQTGSKAFSFSWEQIAGSDVVAHRIYLNDQKLCESTTPSETSITCYAEVLNQVMSFSMTSVDSLGVESSRSNILVLDPADYPAIFAKKSTTFYWDYDSTSPALTGFKIYHNDTLICETADPQARQLTCDLLLSETNVFKVSAVEGETTETTVSNSITYAKSSAPPGTEGLAAVITAVSQTGEAPFNVAFDGTTSTGPISTYSWSFGDGDTATGSTASHVYQYPGTYTATLTVADVGSLTSQSSLTITVNAPPAPPPVKTPPTAVISSSSAVGQAPFTVQFDGSGSTSAQPPIVSHSWAFGDGASAEGTAATHTFNVAGTYHTTLTVTDSVGLTNQTSTPVLINAAPVVANQKPTASFTATPATGKTPLNVSFNASGSSDPDGSIASYVWSFGDGSSASGVSAQHTFTEIADYAVSLQVTDDKGDTAVTSQTISVLAQDKTEINFELQEVQADHTWKTVTFSKPFTTPVVVAGPPGFADAAPSTIRIRNVTSTGFEIRIQEWNYLDGSHSAETFGILVMERGVYTLDNGAKLEAGTFSGSTSFQKITLQQTYPQTPIVLTQVLTENETDTVTGRLRNNSQSSFEYKMQEQDKNKVSHKAETIGYIAWEPGKGEYAGLLYEAGLTVQNVTHNWFDLAFQSEFPSIPLFVAGMQTSAEADAAAMRSQNISETTTQIKIEEEQSKDTETSHVGEVVGYLAISAAPQAPVPPEQLPPSDKKFSFTWEYGDTQNVSGFRFYLNDKQLCETTNPVDRQLTCHSPLLNETMAFTMTAVLLDNSESTPSTVLSISPTDFPELFGIKLATFTWEFDSTLESSISGFRIFANGVAVCETATPADRQLTCTMQVSTSANDFTLKAIGIDGTESTASNTLNYTP